MNLRIVKEDGRTSRYNGRITEEQIQAISPLLWDLHNAGTSRAETVAEVSSRHQIVLTKAQLDGIKKKLGMRYLTTVSQVDYIEFAKIRDPLDNQLPLSQPEDGTTAQSDVSTILAQAAPSIVSPVLTVLEDDEDFAAVRKDDPWTPLQLVLQTHGKIEIQVQPMHTESPANSTTHAAVSPSTHFHDRLPAGYLQSLPGSEVSYLCYPRHSSDQSFARLFHAALTLHVLGAFDQAFDKFFLIFVELYARQSNDPWSDPRLALCLIYCARSSRGPMRTRVAKSLLDQYHYGHWRFLETPRLGRYLECLAEHLSEPTIAESSVVPESEEMTVRLLATSCRLSRHETETLFGDLRYLDMVRLDSTRRHIYNCPMLRSTILATMIEFAVFIDRRRSSIDERIKSYSPSAFQHWKIHTWTAQIIACEFLGYKAEMAPFMKWYQEPRDRCGEVGMIPCDLDAFVAVALPHVLVQASRKLDSRKHEAGIDASAQINPSLQLQRAAMSVSSKIRLNSPGDLYSSVVDLFLKQTGPAQVFESDHVAIGMDEERLRREISEATGVWSAALFQEDSRLRWRNKDLQRNNSGNASNAIHSMHPTGSPILAPSLHGSSVSSDRRSFRATSARAGKAIRRVASLQDAFQAASSEADSLNNDFRFSVVTGFSSGPSDRQTVVSDLSELSLQRDRHADILSDVAVSG